MEVVRTGVTAIIQNADGKFLVGKRIGSHGAGTWQFPGGHLDKGERIFACAARETLEETGLKIVSTEIVKVTEDIFEEEEGIRHYITVFTKCHMLDQTQEPKLLEPNKCQGWHWKSWEELKEIHEIWKAYSEADPNSKPDPNSRPDALFLPLLHLVEQVPDIHKLLA
ncbi:uncharacterized protein TRIVIDRAFT_32933 [Trichoderma virens Gv29-8]|uniref:Nudix hydrolase domain-containing protein n=1 Tax=Hypocrea virens (strain Gv29-8 / FGSC 10586) TaxID=413071 RepID=G9MIX1_HYPVG|nr:uncharacterized protein TRIVIDRAFT_32933 [Trichoderma virens Gv29-8]EHK25437.1 hypothetical protein TRIVIDRAFT_32933 [Trichoderma virens Gv29-8]